MISRRHLPAQLRARGVTAVLGPTNTGKTHLAIERMLGHESGMIGLPLRLLAREVYQRVVDKAGAANVALVTGEEKIKPDRPRYWVSTVEAMPRDLDLAFVAVDEVQLAADLDRGHVFTDRLLNQRGREETLLIGSATVRPLIEALVPGVHVVTRPRLSKLSFAGEKKISRLPARSAIVAFSAEEVYAIAELIRRQRGGAAVVLGALSPRTRNAQVELYQSGDVDYLIATDAIGMGLNLDVDHVAFASDKKFDGFRFRKLYPAELGQVAGRAGRHMRDGTFGTSGRCPPFDAETIDALENHQFDPLRVLQWRNADLDFSTLAKLRDSLAEQPREHGLVRAPMSEDLAALEIVSREDDIGAFARSKAAVERLWQVCQVPDYGKVSPASHADLVGTLYRFLMRDGAVPADWFARHVAMVDRTDGDIDTLSGRIAQVRTWTFVANRPDWLKDPEHWQGVARQVEDKLSDALHERLASRFVDRRTSVLMRRLRENAMLEAEVTATGDVTVEGQHVGHLHGFHFVPDPQTEGAEAKAALRNAAQKALASEIEARAERFSAAADASLVLSNDGTIRWTGDPVAKLEPGDKLFEPRLRVVADEQLTGPARDKVEGRLKAWLKAHIVRLLGPLLQLEDSPTATGIARGIAFQIAEALGVLERSRVLQEVRGLDQDGRAALRQLGVRFGAYHLYLPALLKPAPRTLAAQLWALKNGGLEQKGIEEIAHLAGSGRTSIPVDPDIAKGLYRAAGFRVCGGRAVRVDILERLADLIRPAIAYRPGITPGEPPPGAADNETFVPTVSMTSLVGCSGEDFASILKSLGYVMDRRPGPPITVPLAAAPSPPQALAPTPDGGDATAAAGDGQPAEAAPATTGESAATPEIGDRRRGGARAPGRACRRAWGGFGERGRRGRCRSRHRTHRPVRDRRADGGRRRRRGGRSRGRGCRPGGGRRTGGPGGGRRAGPHRGLAPAPPASRRRSGPPRTRALPSRRGRRWPRRASAPRASGPARAPAGRARRAARAPRRSARTPLKPMPQEPRPGRRAARAAPTSGAERSGRGAAPRRGAATVRSRAAARSAATSPPTRTRLSPSWRPSRRSSKAATGTSAEGHRRPATPASSARPLKPDRRCARIVNASTSGSGSPVS